MSEVLELRKWIDLALTEKQTIIASMLNSSDKNSTRAELVEQFGITEWSISSILAWDTMRRQKEISEKPNIVMEEVQEKVYRITTVSEIDESMRIKISEEFKEVADENHNNTSYDYYLDIYALADYFDIDPIAVEQYLRRRFPWLEAKLETLKETNTGIELSEEIKNTIRDFVNLGSDEKDKKQRRKDMAKKYNVSIYVIGAITAWKKWSDGGLQLGKDFIEKQEKIEDQIAVISEKSVTELSLWEWTSQSNKERW